MKKSKARTFVRILLAIGISVTLLSRYFLEEGPLRRTFQNIGVGIIMGSFLFVVLAFIFPRWFMDKQKTGKDDFKMED